MKTYYETAAEQLATELAKWPESLTFGLRGHAGTFRVSHRDSYHNGETIQLYTEKRNEKPGPAPKPGAPWDPFAAEDAREWQAFAKGTPEELRREMVPQKAEPVKGQPRYSLHDLNGKRLDLVLSDHGAVLTFVPDPSYTGALAFRVEDLRPILAEILLEPA